MRERVPTIVKQAERLLSEIEAAVSRFPRRYRYTVGARLSEQAFETAYAANLAWSDKQHRDELIQELSVAIDRLKLRMQLAQQVQAFASFAQFEALSRVAVGIGKQCGGWQKKRTSTRQNDPEPAPGQSPQILSSRAASSEATL